MDTTRRLPGELTDYTIDFLHGDAASLKACSLTCRSFLASSRYHLFGAITISSQKDAEALKGIGAAEGSVVKDYVRTLRVGQPSSSDTSFQCALPATLDSASITLPSLRRLHLDAFRSYWQPASFSLKSYANSPTFSGVESLELTNSSLKTFSELKHSLENWTDLKHLSLDGVSFGLEQMYYTPTVTGDDGATLTEDLFKTSLTSLHIANNPRSLAILFDWLLSTPSRRTLRHVSFANLKTTDLSAVNSFLTQLGDSVERLDIALAGDDLIVEDPSATFPISLSKNTSLNSVTLRDRTSRALKSWASPLLASTIAPSPVSSIKTLSDLIPLQTITFSVLSYNTVPKFNLSEMVDVDVLAKIPALRTITYAYVSNGVPYSISTPYNHPPRISYSSSIPTPSCSPFGSPFSENMSLAPLSSKRSSPVFPDSGYNTGYNTPRRL